MGIFDSIRKKSENGLANPGMEGMFVGGNFFDPTRCRYADAYLLLVFNRIFSALKNVRYTSVNVSDEEAVTLQQIFDYLEQNMPVLMWLYWSYGYIVIDSTNTREGLSLNIPDYSRVRLDNSGRVLDHPNVYYSDTYIIKGKSDFGVLAHNVRFIDTLKNAEEYLTSTLGAFGILSSKDMPINTAEKEILQNDIKRKYGITGDKMQLMISARPIDFKQVDMNVEKLHLSEKVTEEVKLLAGYFNVPYDLIPFSGASTYANQEQAVQQFYSGCIRPIAEIGIKLANQLMRSTPLLLGQKYGHISFTIDNVPELEDDRSALVEYKIKFLQMIQAAREAGVDVTEMIREFEDIK